MSYFHADLELPVDMKLKQFAALCEIVDSGFSISRAATVLHAAQPGISKQIKTLEDELGFEILVRKKNKIVGLTVAGEAVHDVAKRIAHDANLLKTIRAEFMSLTKGQLTVATTHIHARYTLLRVIKEFCAAYPEVSFTLRHSDPMEIAELVAAGKVDLGISVPPKTLPEDVACIPCYTIHRLLITHKGHPLISMRQLDLVSIAKYPLVIYDSRFSSGWRVLDVFAKRNLHPKVVLTAMDAEVVKAYVGEGLGVAFLQKLAFDKNRDTQLAARSIDSLIEPPTAAIMVKKRSYIRSFTYRFIELVAPKIDRRAIRAAIEGEDAALLSPENSARSGRNGAL